MEDDFTAWLFNESSVPSSSIAYPSWTGVIPSYLDAAQLQTQTHGMSLGGGISDRPMSVARTSDPGSPLTTRKEFFLEGDVNNDNHILSLRMTRTYIESYWYHFHLQLPILHRSAFVADHAPNLLLLAIIAIGASTLDRIHGPGVAETVSEFANFIVWHLRWEVFMDTEFQAPTKLWVYQALLLIEVREKMYSTRFLHERAHIHHDTTLALMRRGSLFIGRSADCFPASPADDRLGSNTTPDSALDESWTHWITAEATRRVVFAALVLDSTHAAMFGQPAKMTAHELRLPLPCDEALWSATSAADVVRVQSSLRANGAKPLMFLDGLKETLDGRRVRTDAFGRSIIMTGLLSVLGHMKQRGPQACSLDIAPSSGGRDNRRPALLRAFDNWRRDFDDALRQSGTPPFGCEYRARRPPGDNYLTETRGVLHGIAHMASHIDIVECQNFADAVWGTGKSRESSVALDKMVERWAVEASAREAAFYAFKFLSECLLHGASEDEDAYSGRDDYNLNRPWVVYMAALVVWCYGFAVAGPILLPPTLATAAEQRRDMLEFLKRVGGVRSPHDLQGTRRRNRCVSGAVDDSARRVCQDAMGAVDKSHQFARQLHCKPTRLTTPGSFLKYAIFRQCHDSIIMGTGVASVATSTHHRSYIGCLRTCIDMMNYPRLSNS
ncbi:Transcription factor, fungi [Metarhizium guizhouense ARSEF 977]|uniref:Transcription factor, fungi n=1 Tax=Metarhizium guizhouense (strain ARSEF 977) TaxID=1276136 RepID=A0A0B4GZR6_METGA|nr:Transcription factor, fungi [Metarhizium guizhouense ARSEF 977]